MLQLTLARAGLVVGLSTTATIGVSAQSPNQGLDQYQRSLDSLVPALLEELAAPGAAVALIREGKVVLAKGYGWADRERREPVTTATLFNIGSISKTVAAWGLLKLVHEGKLDLDAPVDRYLTRWKLPASQFDHAGVTLRRLLSHTAGLSLHGYPGFDPSRKLATIEESLSGNTNGVGDVRVIMPPGSKWQYSGGGYTIAQLMVEEVTGRSFDEYMKAEVLGPLGMTASSYVWNDMVTARAATPYGLFGSSIPGPRFIEQAAAGLQTSLDDFIRFALASLSSGRPELATRVLPPSLVAKMQEPVPPATDYGLGYSVREVAGGGKVVGHGGANEGWMANFLVNPASGDGLVVMTNSTTGGAVHGQLFCEWQRALYDPTRRCRKGIAMALAGVIGKAGADAAVARYRQLKQAQPDAYDFREFQLNMLGNAFLEEKRVDDAIAILRLNVEAYPGSSTPYESLGAAFLARGDTALALVNYRKALELNPASSKAADAIKQLRP